MVHGDKTWCRTGTMHLNLILHSSQRRRSKKATWKGHVWIAISFAIYFSFYQYEIVLQDRFGQLQWVWLFSALLSRDLHTLVYPRNETERHSLIVNLCLLLFCSPSQRSYVRWYRSAGQMWIWNPAKRVFTEVGNQVATGRWSTHPVSRRNSEIRLFQKSFHFEGGNRWMKKCHVRKTEQSSHWLLLLLI